MSFPRHSFIHDLLYLRLIESWLKFRLQNRVDDSLEVQSIL